MDTFILNWINNNMTSPVLDSLMTYISMIGDHGIFYIVLGAGLLIPKKLRMLGVAILMALVFESVTVNLVLKPLIGRIRPFEFNELIDLIIRTPEDFSFPSGHTAASFAVASVIFICNRRWGTAAGIIAVLIAFSRLYLYVHWPSDVLAGAVIGIVAGIISVLIITKTKIKKYFEYNDF